MVDDTGVALVASQCNQAQPKENTDEGKYCMPFLPWVLLFCPGLLNIGRIYSS